MKNRPAALIKTRRRVIAGLFLLVLLVAGFGLSCQSPEPAPPATSPGLSSTPPKTSPQFEVMIEGFAFRPAEINVPVGGTINWHNKDSVTHTVSARDKTFDSGSLRGGGTFSHTFEEKGTFEYHCVPHPYMEGKVVVE